MAVASRSSAASRQPPGPKGLPHFGCVNGLLRNPMEFWRDIAVTYGGIARVPLKGKHVYLISDPELLHELLITNRDRYRKNTRYKAAVDTFGDGLLLLEGEPWARQRKMTQPTFKASHVKTRVPEMAMLIGRVLERMRPLADAEREYDVGAEFRRLSQLVAGHYLFGPGFDAIEERFLAASTAIMNNWPLPPRHALTLYVPHSKRREQRLEAAIADIERLIFDYIEEHRQTDFADCGLLGTLVAESRAQGEQFDDRSLRDQLLTLFFAGHETSATSLSWIHYLLSQHTEARDALHREVRDVVGDADPTAEHLAGLEYTERVINESLRLNSPIHSISRVALEDDVIGGYPIPAGSTIYVSLFATHRLPWLWPEPEQFDPDRFLPANAAERPRFAFIPFAAGHRNCVGAPMAMDELKLAVAQLARRYVLDLAPGHPVVRTQGTTMQPRYGMKMSVRHATGAAA